MFDSRSAVKAFYVGDKCSSSLMKGNSLNYLSHSLTVCLFAKRSVPVAPRGIHVVPLPDGPNYRNGLTAV